LLGDAGKLLSLAAVLMPVVGLVARWVFLTRYVTAASDLALRAPLSALAATGFWAIAPGLGYATGLLIVARYAPVAFAAGRQPEIERRAHELLRAIDRFESEGEKSGIDPARLHEDADQLKRDMRAVEAVLAQELARRRAPSRRGMGWAVLEHTLFRLPEKWHGVRLDLVAIGVLALVLPNWPAGWIPPAIGLSVVGRAHVVARDTGRLQLARMWWVILAAVLVLALVYGLTDVPVGVYPQRVIFRDQPRASALSDRAYIRLAESGSTEYFLPCKRRDRWIAVDSSEIQIAEGPTADEASRMSSLGAPLVAIVAFRARPSFAPPDLCRL
jgi:hypothetical protein